MKGTDRTTTSVSPKSPKKPGRPMPEDPRLLAKAMFEAADKKIEERKAGVKAR